VTFSLYATIWIALAAFVAGEAGKARHPVPPWAWATSLVGAMLCTVHIVIAFGHHHHWSHSAAIDETARQTASVYGVAWGGGVYVNYAFVAAWLAELWWWRTRPSDYFARRPAIVWSLRAFFFTIIFNAAVVFATTRMRVAGVVLTLGLLFAWTVPSRWR
jgi:hypothetical protein